MQGPDAYEIIGNKIKVKYSSYKWNQHEPDHLDIFTGINKVSAICGDDAACWLDAYHWSLMKQTKLTEDIYQFITHRVYVIKKGFKTEVDMYHANGGFNLEPLEPIQYAIKKGAMNIIDFIF